MSALGMLGGEVDGGVRCSRAGCRDRADWAIEWRNPKIHSQDRRKTWMACEAHRSVLEEFLAARDFPLHIAPVAEVDSTSSGADLKEHDA